MAEQCIISLLPIPPLLLPTTTSPPPPTFFFVTMVREGVMANDGEDDDE